MSQHKKFILSDLRTFWGVVPYNNEINNLIFVRVKIYFSKKFNVRDILNYKIAYLSLWERKEIFYNEIKENFYR